MPDTCYIYQSGYPTLACRIQLIFQVEALHYYLSIIFYIVLLLLFLGKKEEKMKTNKLEFI